MFRGRLWLSQLVLLVPFATCSCDVLDDLLDQVSPRVVTVRLINDGDFDVDATLYISDEGDIPESLLSTLGERIDRTVGPGETSVFSRDCDKLQAIVLDDAELKVIGSIGPETQSGVLRDESDFDCRNVIEFTFDHSAAIVDFDVSVTVRN